MPLLQLEQLTQDMQHSDAELMRLQDQVHNLLGKVQGLESENLRLASEVRADLFVA